VVWIAIVACVAAAITILCWTHFSKARRDANAVAAAQDEVYEAVVGYITTAVDGRKGSIRRLVFDQTVIAGFGVQSGPIPETCKEDTYRVLRANDLTPPFIYRFIYHLFGGTDDGSLQSDTIEDFAEKACTSGPLSQTFHTVLPRSFISADSVYFEGWSGRDKTGKPFERLFPGACGIISFSHVGFDSSLHEAIVSTSFVCGGLCGSGRYYVLKKRSGRWRVVSGSMVWVS